VPGTPHAARPDRAGGVARQAGTVLPLVGQVLPVLGEQFLAIAVGFTDKWLAGNLFADEAPLAAVGLVAYCLAFLPAVFAVPAVAVTALVARSVGAGDRQAARRFGAQAFVVGAALVVAGLAVAAAVGPGLVRSLGLPAASADLAVRYLAIVIPALPLMMLIHVGVAILRGAGDMQAGLVAMTTVNLVNAAASFALAAGVGGLPRLGWDGLAWGTFIGYGCGALVVGLLLARPATGLRPRRADWRPHRDSLRRLLRTGLPAGIDAAANSACHLTFLSIVNRVGNVDAAAHSVAIAIESLAFLPGSAFQIAAATLAGQFLGARDERRARGSVWAAAIACVVLMSAAAAVFLGFSRPLAAWFTGGAGRQPEVAALTAELVRIVAFAQPPLALLMVFSGGLRGAGATRLPAIVNFVSLILVRLPLATFLAWPAVPLPGGAVVPGLGLGAAGAWYAMAIDLTIRGLAMLVIFTGTNWTRVRV
jgi:putative MATE family efflux protein